MTAPKIGERHRECLTEIQQYAVDHPFSWIHGSQNKAAEIIAKHFPEDDSWVDAAINKIASNINYINTMADSKEQAQLMIQNIFTLAKRGELK